MLALAYLRPWKLFLAKKLGEVELLLCSQNNWTKSPLIFISLLGLMLFLAACQTIDPAPDSTPALTPGTISPTLAQKTDTAPTRTPTTAPTPASTLGIDPQDLDNITVTFWHVWNELPGSALEALVAEFNAQNEWGIRVNSRYTGTYDDQFASVLAALSTPEQPDIVVGYIYQTSAWDTNDQVVDLNPYVNDPIWGLGQSSEDFFTPFWDSDVVAGKRLGIPALRSGQYLFYNQTWAEELGFDSAPGTPTQFRQQACAAAEANQQDDDRENDGTGGYILSTDYSVILAWIGGFGGDVVTSAGRGYQFDTPSVQNAFHYLRDLYDRGCAWLQEEQLPDTAFVFRRGLFASGSLLDVPEQFYTFSQTTNRDRWTLIPYPSNQGTPVVDVYGPSFGILQSSSERELASWLFIRWLAEPENQIRFTAATSSLPLGREAQQLMEARPLSPQWQAAVDALEYARSEPAFHSWMNVRWAVSDAATQLFRYYFTIDQVPTLIELLDNTAEELHER
jgi:multiple sugar transport system substrate-binding protein